VSATLDRARIKSALLQRLTAASPSGVGVPVFTSGEEDRTKALEAWVRLVAIEYSGAMRRPGDDGDDATASMTVTLDCYVREAVTPDDLAALDALADRVCRSLEGYAFRDDANGYSLSLERADVAPDPDTDPRGFRSAAIRVAGSVSRDPGRTDLRAAQWTNP
jgi:hypothetical protein